ncbi:UDP-glucose dehydrogenase family protein [Deinococcus roseus]|uniref:UDP-glucose 6-dehydrogenase n=1 Tax=Deinococcus roseus TaxID=392414 RepID=A0ABQ2CVL8_9DEIO|nr:UDP-glucose/GDP-mannose dehydrogenase family protein [Deinococcus roseus]GGJ24973.1 UDP-glucose 6-dehydrogenase [Deinococcus roseus]
MQIGIIGTGYVGLTTSLAFAYIGHDVYAIDKDARKVEKLRQGEPPIHEEGLRELLQLTRNHLVPTTDYAGLADCRVIFIAVGTPTTPSGEADTSYLEQAVIELADVLKPDTTYYLVVKSTVPIGTNRKVLTLLKNELKKQGKNTEVAVGSNPEFLREGYALYDTFYPDRVVVGAHNREFFNVMRELYDPILEQTFEPPEFLPRPASYHLPPLITTEPTSAEMIKYAANAFLALKISYINEIAGLCERVGADVMEVSRGIGLDERIGSRFLQAGIGWGGSCFPKDTLALNAIASEYQYDLDIVSAAIKVNDRQIQRILEKIQSEFKVIRGLQIAVLGAAFKPNTDDTRDSPGIKLARELCRKGAYVRMHDPIAKVDFAKLEDCENVQQLDTVPATLDGADVVVVATEWRDYINQDWNSLLKPSTILIDGRNCLAKYSFEPHIKYHGIGRGNRR